MFKGGRMMNDRLIAKTVVGWWMRRLIIAGRANDLLVSDGNMMLAVPARHLVFDTLRLSALPAEGEWWEFSGDQAEPFQKKSEGGLAIIWQKTAEADLLPLKLTRWLFDSGNLTSRLLEFPDGRTVYVQKHFVDIFADQDEDEDVRFGSLGGLEFRGSGPEEIVVVYRKGVMIGAVMPLRHVLDMPDVFPLRAIP